MATLPDLQITTAPARRTTRKSDTIPFRVVLLGDFAGSAPALSLADRPLLRSDIDNLEQCMGRIAPRLESLLDDPEPLTFNSLDAFHPDRLYRDRSALARLGTVRAELLNPAQASAAIAKLGGAAPTRQTAAPRTAETAVASPFEQLLGGRPAQAALPGNLERLLAEVVHPHVVATGDVQPYLEALELAAAEALRELLHDPSFQALEANWRGLAWLLSQLPDDPSLEIYCLTVSEAELRDDLLTEGKPLDQSTLYRRLLDRMAGAPDDAPWTLLVGLYDFAAETESVRLLAALGSISVAVGATLVAAAAPSLAGCNDAAMLAEPDQWQIPGPSVVQRWQALRSSTIASRIGLLLPRLLLRLPYGAGGNAVESFGFEELPHGPCSDHLLWGNPALAATLAWTQGFLQDGWAFDPAAAFDIDDVPAYSYSLDGVIRLQPATEVVLSERAATALTGRGLTPLLAYRNRNRVRLPGCLAIDGSRLSIDRH